MIALAYHRVTHGPVMGGGWVLPRQFAFHLRQILSWGFSPLLPRQVPENCSARSFLLTFDDAYLDVFQNAFPIMQGMGLLGVAFPIAGFLAQRPGWDITWGTPGLHMGKAQLRALSEAGWEIGSHTMTHPDLRRLSSRALRAELADSKALLEDVLGREVRFLAYPFGRFNERVKDAARDAGFTVGFTMRRARGLSWGDPLEIPRVSVYLPDYSLYRKLEPFHAWWDSRLERLINLNAGGTAWVRHRAPWLGRLLGMKPR